MKNLLNIILIVPILFAFGCKEEKVAEKPQSESIEPKIEQVAKKTEEKKTLQKDLIQVINNTGEVSEEAMKGVKIETKKTSPKPKKIDANSQKAIPKKTIDAEQSNNSSIGQPAPSEPKAVQVSEKIFSVNEKDKGKTPNLSAAPSHTDFDKLLKNHVSNAGNVDYKSLKNNHAALKTYLSELSNNPPQTNWSRNEKLAFWINAYNAHTIDLILKSYPLNSITDLDGGSPWKVKRITIGGKQYSLDQIENQIIRPRFKDARIHFAVNCAAKSCPSLLNEAFLPSKLNAQLNRQTKKFINNKSFNSISENSVSVSKIFEWYAVDFGNLIEYLNQYSVVQISPGAKVNFEEYNWDLNGI